MSGNIRINRNYHDNTKEILKKLSKKATGSFYVDLTSNGVFIETRMIPNGDSECYNNIKLEIPSSLVLSEILDSLYNSYGCLAYFCKDGVECFTFDYIKQFGGGD